MSMKKFLIPVLFSITAGSLIYLYWYYTASGESEIYLLPNNYRGIIYIIFDQKNGAPKQYENGSRVYVIPRNGILKTQFRFNKGWHQLPSFYYTTSIHERILIRSQGIFVTGGSGGTAVSDLTKVSVSFFQYTVGQKQELDSLTSHGERINPANL